MSRLRSKSPRDDVEVHLALEGLDRRPEHVGAAHDAGVYPVVPVDDGPGYDQSRPGERLEYVLQDGHLRGAEHDEEVEPAIVHPRRRRLPDPRDAVDGLSKLRQIPVHS